MADKSITVRVQAQVGQYVAAMGQAGAATTTLARNAEKSATSTKGLTDRITSFASSSAMGATAALGLAGGIGFAVKTYADFDKAMAGVKANVDLGNVSWSALTDTVKSAGTQFGFSATQSADATNDLAKAGLNASQIMGGGLKSALALAAAGEISTGDAAEIAANAMTQFGLSSKDLPHVADLIAAGADKSTASVGSLSQGLMAGGSSAHMMGLSLQDTVGLLAEFDQNGLKGESAGTALKVMFQQLTSNVKTTQAAFKAYNIQAFDAQGQFVGMANLADQLKTQLGGLDQKTRMAALSQMFGTHALQAANILYKEGGTNVKKWADEVNVAGFASQNAGKKTDSLAGDWNKLKAALDNVIISGGQGGAGGVLRLLTQGATGAVTAIGPLLDGVSSLVTEFGDLPGPVQMAVGGLIAARVAGGLFGDKLAAGRGNIASFVGGLRTIGTASSGTVRTLDGWNASLGRFGSMIQTLGEKAPGIARLQGAFLNAAQGAERFPRAAGLAAASMTGLKMGASGLLGVLGGPWGLALTGATTLLGLWSAHQQDAARKAAEHKQQVQELTQAIQEDGNQIGKSTTNQIAANLVASDTIDKAKALGVSQDLLTKAWLGQPDAIAKVNDLLRANGSEATYTTSATGVLVQTGTKLTGSAKAVQDAMRGQVATTGDAMKAARQLADSQKTANGVLSDAAQKAKDAAAGADLYKQAQDRLKGAVDAAAAANKTLNDTIDHTNNSFLGARGAARDYQSAIDGITTALKNNGTTLDIHTQKGRDNQAALDAFATSTLAQIKAWRDAGDSAGQLQAKLPGLRAELVKQAERFGMTGKAAQDYADNALGSIPDQVSTTVSADTAVAQSKIDAVRQKVQELGGDFDALPKDVQLTMIQQGGDKVAGLLKDVQDKSAALNAGNTFVRTGTNAPGSLLKLQDLHVAAVTAGGDIVMIPCSTPGQAQALRNVLQLDGAAVTADGKSITIDSDVPYAPQTVAKIQGINGARITADGKHVTINTSAPGAVQAMDQILNAGHAADQVNGKQVTITYRTLQITEKKTMDDGTTYVGRGPGVSVQPYNPFHRATGGRIVGPGGPTSDIIPIMGSNGEYMLNARTVDQLGGFAGVDRLVALANHTPSRIDLGGAVPASVSSSNMSTSTATTNHYAVAMSVDVSDLEGLRTVEQFARQFRLTSLQYQGA